MEKLITEPFIFYSVRVKIPFTQQVLCLRCNHRPVGLSGLTQKEQRRKEVDVMKKNIFPIYHKVPKYFAITLAAICWLGALLQTASALSWISFDQSVPAFQKNVTISDTDTQAIPAFKTSQTMQITSPDTLSVFKQNAASCCEKLSYQIDCNSTIISSHTENGYSDFYGYSPLLEEQFGIPAGSSGNNFQIAFTWDNNDNCTNIYLGMPCIDYDF